MARQSSSETEYPGMPLAGYLNDLVRLGQTIENFVETPGCLIRRKNGHALLPSGEKAPSVLILTCSPGEWNGRNCVRRPERLPSPDCQSPPHDAN